MEQEVLIHLHEITKQYQMGEVKVDALLESTVDIMKGELMVIMGPAAQGRAPCSTSWEEWISRLQGKFSFKVMI